jgi:hypothetical protein
MKTIMEELAPYMRGRRGYFGFCQTPEVQLALTRWVRLRRRAALWRQWKTPRRRRGTGRAGSLGGVVQYGRQRPWPLASCQEQSALCRALQCVLHITRSPVLDRSALAQLLEPPYTDPYVRWCGRGGAARLSLSRSFGHSLRYRVARSERQLCRTIVRGQWVARPSR